MTQFRPISLCNVLYKIISKVLVNRLKPFLPAYISESQSAFVPGRLITDNILVAYELLHTLKGGVGGKHGHFALKLDMSKAYDRVEWDFLEGMMLRMGFNSKWVDLIMTCVRSVTYSIILNGEITDSFVPGRGLRQGDPLSPYLFLICTEGLSALLSRGQQEKQLSGVAASRNGPRVSHLFFADDSLLFGRANRVEGNRVMDILQIYEKCSGQKVNYDKSAIYFSSNTSQSQRDLMKVIFNLNEEKCIEKYLGLPAMVGRNRQQAFWGIKDRVWKRLQSWKTRMLSQGGREVMIKSVLQAIPTYAMNVFALPKSLCRDLNSMIGRFWWKQTVDRRPIHWLSWKKLCRAKDFGGMGFRDMEKFNVALLAKQGWRLMQPSSSLMVRVLKARYFPRSNFLDARLGWNPSYTWRSIWQSREMLQHGTRWRVGNGSSISVMKDKWIPSLPQFRITTEPNLIDEDLLVEDLINGENRTWNVAFIEQFFSHDDVEAILQIPLSRNVMEDQLVWHFDNKGCYSVRSGYRVLCNMDLTIDDDIDGDFEENKAALRMIWSANVPPKIRVFGWRLYHEILPVMDNLYNRRLDVDRVCFRCRSEPETVAHAIRECDVVKEVWQLVESRFRESTGDQQSATESDAIEWNNLSLITAWSIWNSRNTELHEGVRRLPLDTTNFIFAFLQEYIRCNKAIAPPTRKLNVKWRNPNRGIIKINFDASFNKRNLIGGYGAIARDHEGLVLGAFAGCRNHIHDPVIMECTAAIKAMEWALNMGFRKIQMEGDALVVIKKLNSNQPDLSPIGGLILDAQRLQFSFELCDFLHIHREGNRVAHDLAQFGLTLDFDSYWMEEAPSWLHDCLNNDILNI